MIIDGPKGVIHGSVFNLIVKEKCEDEIYLIYELLANVIII